MQLSELSAQLQFLVGLRVESKTIAGNTIYVWLDEDKSKGIIIDPPWRLLTVDGIAGSSADFPWERDEDESENDYRRRFEAACAYTDTIQGKLLVAIFIDQRTTDLRLTFEGGLELCSFTVWRGENNWQHSDCVIKKRFSVSVSGVSVEDINA